ncbi:amidase family protein [Actinomadura luteofluorescens]|uniref:amidase family protein n=1 Tax=Actinomadura luteofluorescens TaxID=46163 RepID=UPI002164CA4A|nr:amidase family protein [Actinomadura glauciflava]MCR3741352.1 amidase [Actinomadura glauciflava]
METAFFERMTVGDLLLAMAHDGLTAEELTVRCLNRIERLNPLLHAVISVNPYAPEEARRVDRLRASGFPLGPLAGIPVLVKDNIDALGLPTTAGSEALRHVLPHRDAELVARLRRSGAIILGKTNLTEWAAYRSNDVPNGWSPVGGQTRNPYVLDRSPYGSSSGSAVAAAAGLAPVTIGTETFGSIVSPSGMNSVVGFKPSMGRVSRDGIVPISPFQDTAGPITRNVADAAAVFQVIATPRRAIRLETALLAGTRIGVWRGVRNSSAKHSDVNRVLAEATAMLHELGATTVEVDLTVPDTSEVLSYEFKVSINDYLGTVGGDGPHDLGDLIAFRSHPDERTSDLGLAKFEQAQDSDMARRPSDYLEERVQITEEIRGSIGRVFGRHRLDAIMSPTNGRAPEVSERDFAWLHSCSPAAVGGYPSIAVPAGYADSQLPLGVSFTGRRNRDEELLGLAYSFEQATQARKRPLYLPTLPA